MFIVIVGLTLILSWYILLPAINIFSIGFWIYLLVNMIIISIIYGIYSIGGFISKNLFKKDKLEDQVIKEAMGRTTKKRKSGKKYDLNYFITISPLIVLVVLIVGVTSSSKILNSKSYSQLLEVETGNFAEDIEEISFNQIPTVDRVTAIRLGDRKMGEMVELASQFNVSSAYTQIDFKGKPVRVTPLEYNGFFKWLSNSSEGIPSYIMVDMVDGKTELRRLEENIKYSKSDKFSRNIKRHIRKKYPTKIIHDISFEVDEKGRPFWIAPIYKRSIGLFGGQDVESVIITDAANGKTEKYEIGQVPNWVDRVYDADRIINQIDDWGSLKGGFINSKLAQKGVMHSTEGYNYLAIDGDVYLYTGVTSASRDSSNVGFILSNLRTKETKFYEKSSADEVSAMGSAMGEVQEKEYRATFPILLNINDEPTYFMALKDNAELIKAYAFVNAEDYQSVSVGATVAEALKRYGGDVSGAQGELLEDQISIGEIKELIIDGNSYYFIRTGDKLFKLRADLSKKSIFLKSGDSLLVEYYLDDEGIGIIKEIK